jgi:2,3-bisphosphoglycerate-dependent phosphoglycerate mutase
VTGQLVLLRHGQSTANAAGTSTDVLGRDAPIESTWRLNERNHGALTGMSKQGAQAALGAEEFFAVRRTRTGRPPRMTIRAWLALRRTPALRDGQTMLVVAHGNSLRALCACMDSLTDGELADLNLPTGEPLIYQFDGDGGFCPRGGEYLHPAARAAAAAVAAEGGT